MIQSDNDRTWAQYNLALEQAIGEQNYEGMAVVYQQMAGLVRKSGIDDGYLIDLAVKMRRQSFVTYAGGYSAGGVNKIEILANLGRCSVCASKQGEPIAINDALLNFPLPVRGCLREFCRCTYIPVLDK